MRSFAEESVLVDDRLELSLAPALTPAGLVEAPQFFSGFAAFPQVVARGLATLADITATRYFQHVPQVGRDPVLSAQGDRLRAECFSACNSVYARLDLLGAGFDGGDIGFGTTNVDVGLALRQALAQVKRDQLLHMEVGSEGLAVSSLDVTSRERPVSMPDRWVRALGNAAQMQADMTPIFALNAAQARAFVASLPAATGKSDTGWLTVTPSGVKLAARRGPGAVFIPGLHRLSAIKRLLTNLDGLTFYQGVDDDFNSRPVMVEAALLGARLTLGLTAETWRGFSGEGALLESLATPTVTADADTVRSLLVFEPIIDVARVARQAEISDARVQAALAVLAVSGRVGWDAHEGAYFHRELPEDPDRIDKDNPRLVAARGLTAVVVTVAENAWDVPSGKQVYRVTQDPATGEARCTCAWYLRHGTSRGPCKHILATQLEGQA